MFGSDVGPGSLLAVVLSLSVNFAQSTLRKFHLLTGRVGTELMVVDDSIVDGLCWDFGKRSRTRRLAHVPKRAKLKSGFVDVPHRAERKLRGCHVSNYGVRDSMCAEHHPQFVDGYCGCGSGCNVRFNPLRMCINRHHCPPVSSCP